MHLMKKSRSALLLLCIALLLCFMVGCQRGVNDSPLAGGSLSSDASSLQGTETDDVQTDSADSSSLTDAPDDTLPNIGDEDAVSNADLLVGTWTTVRREDRGEFGANLLVYTFCFKADGTGTIDDLEYTYYADNPEGEWGDGWSLAGRGYERIYFTYTLNGDRLSRTTIPVEEWDEPYTSVYTISLPERDKLTMDGETYLRGDYDLKTLCSLLNVDYTVAIPQY